MSPEIERPIGESNASVKAQRQLIPWIWEGVLAERAVTLLSAPEKIGKTTLLSLMLDRRRSGGEVLGRTVWPGISIVCSEENKCLWALRQPPLDFGPDLLFHTPPDGIAMRGRWLRFVKDIHDLCFEPRYDLLVIDTARTILPLADRNKRLSGDAAPRHAALHNGNRFSLTGRPNPGKSRTTKSWRRHARDSRIPGSSFRAVCRARRHRHGPRVSHRHVLSLVSSPTIFKILRLKSKRLF